MRHRISRTLLITAVGALVAVGATPLAAQAAPAGQVPGTKPTWLAHAKRLRAAPGSDRLSARVWLTPRGGVDALEAAALAASTPGSGSYGRFLTADQYAARFAPAASDVAAVTKWATGAGLRVGEIGADNSYVTVTASVADIGKAFQVGLAQYTHDGQTVTAPEAAATLPDAVLAHVATVTGLDTTVAKRKPLAVQPDGFRNAQPCSAYYGQKTPTVGPDGTAIPAFQGKQVPATVCGYTGTQLRSAYEGSTALNGSGVTIAILGAYASPTIASDAATYARRNGDAPYRPGQLTQTNPAFVVDQDACGDPTDYYGEETLDIESAHAMAGAANLHYYGVRSCNDSDFVTTYLRILRDDSADIVSTSYGDVGEDVGAQQTIVENLLFARGSLQGISFLNSSGDSGDEVADLGTAEPDFPATSPFVTAVGGTALAVDRQGRIAGQTGWGTEKYTLSGGSWTDAGFLYGSGGGVSRITPKPPYQAGVVSGSMRAVPDMSMVGDPNTGFLVGETQSFPNGTYYDQYRIGGTSLSSPLFAGMTALSVQAAGHRAGLLNPVIYAKRSTAFTDVLPTFPDRGDVRVDYTNGTDASGGYTYSVRTFDDDSSLATTRGYDLVTGVGSPNAGWLTALR